MKKTLLILLLVGALVLVLVCAIVYAKISAPWFYDADGGTLWKHSMSVVHKEGSFPVYRTLYGDAYWNGLTVSINKQTFFAEKWFELVLWNGYGIKKISVRAKRSGQKLDTDASPICLIDDFGGRYSIVGVRPPTGENQLEVRVTDNFGNVTSATVQVSKQ